MIGEAFYHYKILEKIGEGGIGVVYKAQDTELKREAALKFKQSELTCDSETRNCFIQEMVYPIYLCECLGSLSFLPISD